MPLGEARAELSSRLLDAGRPGQGPYVHWTAPELNDLLVEAIRTWQALTGTFKQRATFQISPTGGVDGSYFYDLRSIPSGVLSFFYTDRQLVDQVLACLLEPPLTANWTGSGQYNWYQIVYALQNRINRWLEDTGANVTRNVQHVGTGPSAGRVFLPEAVLDVRRAAWITAEDPPVHMLPIDCNAWSGLPRPGGVYSTLWRDDEFAMQAFRNLGSLQPADPPVVWGKFTLPPV